MHTNYDVLRSFKNTHTYTLTYINIHTHNRNG